MSDSRSRGRRRKGASIEDVARLAGVSAQTVSRVSTGSASVRPTTRQRVLDAMTQLGYSPNRAARALRNGRFGTIGVITQRFQRTGETLTTAAVTEAAESHGLSVNLIQVAHPETEDLKNAAYRLSHQAIDGLIVVRVGHATYESLSIPQGLPVAVSDSKLIGYYPSVFADQIKGTQAAVAHLLALGHRTVHHIAGAPDSQPSVVRQAAWQQALTAAGITPSDPWMGDWTARSGYEAGRAIAQRTDVTAVYCANDEMAFGLLRALHESGRKVPQDVSVVGFDDIALSEFSSPPLTTIHQDFDRIGHELVRLILEQLDGQLAAAQTQVVVPTRLVVRATTAPPGAE